MKRGTFHRLRMDDANCFCDKGPDLQTTIRLSERNFLSLDRAGEEECLHLNRATLQALRDLAEPGEEDLLSEFVEIFLADSPTRLHDLKVACESRDQPLLKSSAHAFKGSSANVGAERLAALCRDLESKCASDDWEAIPLIFARLVEEFGKVKASLQEEVAHPTLS